MESKIQKKKNLNTTLTQVLDVLQVWARVKILNRRQGCLSNRDFAITHEAIAVRLYYLWLVAILKGP